MSAGTVVPLWWRAPNPPSPMVGRDDDVARLRGLLQRSPVALVWGFSGVGKSALVQAVLHGGLDDTDGSGLVTRTLWLRAEGDVVATVWQRLQAIGAAGAARLDETTAPETLAEAIETLGLQVVIDGVERLADHPVLTALARLLARHGRRGRLIVICREDPRDVELSTRAWRVSPLPDAALEALVDAVAPGRPASVRRHMAAAAAGSPWRLLQLALDVDTGTGTGGAPEASLLALSPVARGLLSTLALVDRGLPADVVARATRMPDDEAVRSLVRRGWVESVGGALHLHHAARPIVALGVTVEERRRRRQRLIEALLAPSTDPTAHGLATRLVEDLLADEGPGPARPFVERRLLIATTPADGGDELRRLQRLVELSGVVPDGPVEGAVIALALAVGDPALARLAIVDDRGDDAAAVMLARARLADARGDGDRARAGLAGVLARRDLPDEVLAGALALAADRGDVDVIGEIARRAPSLRPIADAIGGRHLEGALAAFAIVDSPIRSALGGALTRALLDAGRIDEARTLLHALAGPSPAWTLLRLRAGAAAGDDVDWSAVTTTAHRLARIEARLWCLVDALRRSDDDSTHTDELASLGEAVQGAAAAPRLRGILIALRATGNTDGDGDSGGAMDRRRSPDPHTDALLATASSDVATIHAVALQARSRARADGDRLRALELGLLAVDGALAAPPGHNDDDLRALTTTLLTEARTLGVPCLVDELRVLQTVITGSKRDDAALAALAQSPGRRVRRRARALLGDAVTTGPWDRRVLARGLSAPPTAPAVVVNAAGEREWVVDEARQQIVVGRDVIVDLSDKAILLALLVCLLRHGGHATKEQLLVEVWAVREYHPLHHDNRLKVAVRKLRRLLEETLGDDPIEAGDDGYRLRGRVRFVAASSS